MNPTEIFTWNLPFILENLHYPLVRVWYIPLYAHFILILKHFSRGDFPVREAVRNSPLPGATFAGEDRRTETRGGHHQRRLRRSGSQQRARDDWSRQCHGHGMAVAQNGWALVGRMMNFWGVTIFWVKTHLSMCGLVSQTRGRSIYQQQIGWFRIKAC